MRYILIFSLSMTVATLWAQEPLHAPTPLLNVPGLDVASPGGDALTLLAAQRAQAMGFPSVAIGLYRSLLAQTGGDRAQLTLALVTALLDEGRGDEAQEALDSFVGLKGAGWQLRAGLVSAQKGDYIKARQFIADLADDDLPVADRGWFYFLQGVLADAENDPGKARGFYEQAETTATSMMARARFVLAREQARLRSGTVDEALAAEARKNMERLQGRKAGYGFARTYATMLDTLGRKAEAVGVIQGQLLNLPAEERAERDDFQLLLGLIAGPMPGPGRIALMNLLSKGSDPMKQRAALQILARDPVDTAGLIQFRRELDRLLDATPAHPIQEDLLLVRAQLALTAKDYKQAEADARSLLDKFPGSQLKAEAYGVLTSCAWEQFRFRTAADLATKARDELTNPQSAQIRAELGVLVAEAWFRARDFPNAADAYTAVLREVPDGVAAGDLMFQRVLSDIEAGRLEVALQQLDAMTGDPRLDSVNRWQAEWNLTRALQKSGQTAKAYERVNRLLGMSPSKPDSLPPELRARMVWLQARLSLQAGQPDQTIKLVDALADALPADIPQALIREVASSGALLKAEANFKLGNKEAAVELLQKLRADFPRSDAAIYSIIVEADYFADLDQTVEAQRLYTKLADDFPNNATYAPYALYQAALQAERRGQDANLVEANKLIEGLVTRYPDSPLVFFARLKQGDLLRKLNQFAQAQQVYEALVNNYQNRGDVILAQLALAECHNAQSLNDLNHADRAITLFEQLRDRVDAPVDVRVEAGFNLGYLMVRRGQPNRAEAIWWRDVVTAFLLDEKMAANLGPKGRYWMTRSLLELGSLYEQQAKLEQARDAWSLIVTTGLPGATLAKDRLARFTATAATP
ncbi:MAG: tetratricopeptide repeat protein [Cephaloticoccus sp.]|nr:tetratricopeptide repeat protein [Cephaloticoccus sp.]MCF7759112.1 tetratricopeptide repeat protein [Cephaloticoccus sp.]